jgi:phosphoribosyl-ATP pyrophosphohydrolase
VAGASFATFFLGRARTQKLYFAVQGLCTIHKEWHMSDTLQRLAATIHQRRSASGEKSYTLQLLDAGSEKCAKKFGEEAVEFVIAGVSQDDKALTAEAADVLYHLLVLLEARGVPLTSVLQVLEGRMGTSGIDEKASRPGSQQSS